MLKEGTNKKKKVKEKAQRKAMEENNDNSLVVIPEGITDSKDEAFVLIPVSSNCLL